MQFKHDISKMSPHTVLWLTDRYQEEMYALPVHDGKWSLINVAMTTYVLCVYLRVLFVNCL